jgi:hypothetical protein
MTYVDGITEELLCQHAATTAEREESSTGKMVTIITGAEQGSTMKKQNRRKYQPRRAFKADISLA